ncbi:M48 family metallopeptidase [Pseudoclavibacter caeni]|uniref:M48 family metallopeptidase n=1 Tax=Pseudoclavibacter caeni TaxID=908846 RepID=UPI0015CDACA9|nr:YgjP-like metallopeptidase domain-containing protein [Pseudoclavibacter caeni]NYJ97338.1 hypothetical protein [Pseudoclavibacter caeni]
MRVLTFDDLAIGLRVRPVRRVTLRVLPDGRVTVTAPRGVDEHRLRTFVHARRAWIDRQRARCRTRAAVLPELAWTDPQRCWATARLKLLVPGMIARWAPVLDVAEPVWRPRLMHTRWGSCTPATGRVRISLELARFTDPLVEGVVVHELAHLRHADHGPGFQTLMTRALPDWRERRRRLSSPRPEDLASGGRLAEAAEG